MTLSILLEKLLLDSCQTVQALLWGFGEFSKDAVRCSQEEPGIKPLTLV